jgi:predicted DNA-binding transcriptional regulator AlpA
MEELLSISEFAKLSGFSRQWIYHLLSSGEINKITIGGKPFIHKDFLKKVKKN